MAQRTAAIDSMLEGAGAAAILLGAGDPLRTRTDTYCNPGDRGWPHNDDDVYRSTCHLIVTTAYILDTPAVPALVPGLRSSLAAAGWHNSSALDDLGTLRSELPSGAILDVRVQASSVAPPAPEPVARAVGGRGSYFGRTEGRDWQDAWRGQRADHPYVLVVRGSGTFAEQPWP